MKFLKAYIFIVFIIFSQQSVAKPMWDFNSLSVNRENGKLEIVAKNISSPFFDNDLKNLKLSCVSTKQIYPVINCPNGKVGFSYNKLDYSFLIDGWFNASKQSWSFSLSNESKTIEVKSDSKQPSRLLLDIKHIEVAELSTLLKQYVILDAENLSVIISANIIIETKNTVQVKGNYTIENFSWESVDYIFAESQVTGDFLINQYANGLGITVNSMVEKGEGLFKDIYVLFDENPVSLETKFQIDNKLAITNTALTFIAEKVAIIKINATDFNKLNINIEYDVFDLKRFYQGFIASYMEILGVEDLEIEGNVKGIINFGNGDIERIESEVNDVYLAIDSKKIEMNNIHALLRWQNSGEFLKSKFNWDSLLLAGMPVNQSQLEVYAVGQKMKLPNNVSIPIFDGSILIKNLHLTDLFEPDIAIDFEGEVKPISLELVTEKMGWPLMKGSLSGKVPGMKKVGQSITFDGSLDLNIFDGTMQIDNLSMERLFGIAPVIATDINFQNLDLQQITSTFDFGEITGLVKGYVKGLRVTNWKPDRLDAYIESINSKKINQTISQRAIDNISSIGGIHGALSRSFLRFFDYFKYKKIAIGCRLRNSICEMSGVENGVELTNTYKLIEGKGIPSINIIGFRKFIDWEVFLNRLLNAGY